MKSLCGMLLLFLCVAGAHAEVYRVDADSTSPSPNGASWASAYSTIRDAVQTAHQAGGGEVWVAEGTYTGSAGNPIDSGGAAAGDTSLILLEGVHVYGGFSGVESIREERDWQTRSTIIDGQNVRRGVFSSGIPYGGATLDGFTIRRGHATEFGGGLYNDQSAPFIANCRFEDNHAALHGGGVFNYESPALLFAGRSIYDTEIAEQAGVNLVPAFSGVIFQNNSATYGGGGLYSDANFLVLEGCVFDSNTAGVGGGMYDKGGKTEFLRSTFQNNTATDAGAGYCYEGTSTTEFTNCLLNDNNSGTMGGAIYHDGYRVSLTHTTIAENSAPQGGGVFNGQAFSLVLNSIAYDNGASNIDDASDSPFAMLASCLEFEPANPAQGVVNVNPLFVDPNQGYFGLLPASPGRDTALQNWAQVAEDINGAPRPIGPAPDMGAFEVHAPTGGADTDNDGLSDAWELYHFGNLGHNGAADSDGDGLSDALEHTYGTDPTQSDTDGDGVTDGREVASGSDPRSSDSVPVPVNIPDPALEAAIRAALAIPAAPLLPIDLALTSFTTLDAENMGITDLRGLNYCTKLTTLKLGGNAIADLSEISELINLRRLYLGGNEIEEIGALTGLTELVHLEIFSNSVADISPLSSLANLTYLNASYNPLSSIEALSGLTRLTQLSLYDAGVTDIGPLSTLTALTNLWLTDNQVSDLTPLAGHATLQRLYLTRNHVGDVGALAELSGLTVLSLDGNRIADISALAANVGLGSGDTVRLDRNPLSQDALCTSVPALRDRGATVQVTGSCGTDADHDGLADAYENLIGTNRNLADTDGDGYQDGTEVIAGTDPRDSGSIPYFEVIFPDAALEAIVRAAIAKPVGPLYTTDLASPDFIRLSGQDLGIRDLTGLRYCVNLTQLTLTENEISDVAELAYLPHLTQIILSYNQITDLSPLTELSNLVDLGLSFNQVSVVPDLTGLTSLRTLSLSSCPLVDYSEIARLTQLTRLIINDTDISDLTLVTDLVNLEVLGLDENEIVDLSPLAGLSKLFSLSLGRNQVSDLSPLSTLNLLTHLYLHGNQISDVAPLGGLQSLVGVILNDNRISSLAPLVANAALGAGDSIYASGAPLSQQALCTEVPTLVSRGVYVNVTGACGADADGDGLADAYETFIGTNRYRADTDRDGVDDQLEVLEGSDPLDPEDIPAGVVLFPDPGLDAAVRLAIGKPTGALFVSDLVGQGFTILDASNMAVSDLTGLEYCTDLVALFLDYNDIVDLTPLAGLTDLQQLSARENLIESVEPLADLVQLGFLDIGGNRISSLDGLANLPGLYFLVANDNELVDISPLATIPGMNFLYLGENDIQSIDALEGINLYALSLYRATVDDIGVLSGMQNLQQLDLTGTEVSTITPLAGLPNLFAVYVGHTKVGDIAPLASLPMLRILEIDGLTGLDSLDSLGTMAGIEELYADHLGIADLAPLANLTGLKVLYLRNNGISDVTPLVQLPVLRSLYLEHNQVGDYSGLAAIPTLRTLDLAENGLTGIEDLSQFTQLTRIYLSGNEISDASSLAAIPGLRELDLSSNGFTNFASLPPLTGDNRLLLLGDNGISDLAPLLTHMASSADVHIELGRNPLPKAAFCTQLPALEAMGHQVYFDLDWREEQYVPFAERTIACNNPNGNPDGDDATSLVEINRGTNPLVSGLGELVEIADPYLELFTRVALDKYLGFLYADEVESITSLSVPDAHISDLTGVEHLTGIQFLDLSGNDIVELDRLIANPGLGAGDTLLLEGNPLSQNALCVDLPALIARGVNVGPVSGVCDGDPDEDGLRDSEEAVIGTDPNDPDTDNDGLDDGDEVERGTNPLQADSDNDGASDGVEVAEGSDPLDPGDLPSAVSFADANLELVIRNYLRIPTAPLMPSDVARLVIINAPYRNISDLSGLEHCVNLRELHLMGNNVTDLSPLSGLTRLNTLTVRNNFISDLSPLSTITSLVVVYLQYNQIEDVSPLSALPTLYRLYLYGNDIASIESITAMESLFLLSVGQNDLVSLPDMSGLTGLRHLELSDNALTNLAPLSSLTALTSINLNGCGLTDLSALAPLTELTDLLLAENDITDLSPLSGLTKLRTLDLIGNRIVDIAPLVANTGFGLGDDIELENNPLSQTALCTQIPALIQRNVTVNRTGSCGADADGDGLADAYEALILTNPNAADTDGDGLDDGEEVAIGTDPLNTDSDGDGIPDGTEVDGGTDPLDETSVLSDVYVDGASGNDDTGVGTQTAPWATVAHAVDSVVGNETNTVSIHIAEGVYTELDAVGGALILDSHEHLFGGYEAAGWTRDIAEHETILDASVAANGSPAPNALVLNGVVDVQLDGLTITGAYSTEDLGHDGAGILGIDLDSSTSINACRIYGNVAGEFGNGGIRLRNASPIVSGSTISENVSEGWGGGVYAAGNSAPVFTACRIVSNIAYDGGAGVALEQNATATITNCVLNGNNAFTQAGGAIYIDGGDGTLIANSTIAYNNGEANSGGGLFVRDGQTALINLIFVQNRYHAIVDATLGNQLTIENCLFDSNPEGDYLGDAGVLTGASAINSTVVGASGNVDGAPMFDIVQGVLTSSPIYDPASNRSTLTVSEAAMEPGSLRNKMLSVGDDITYQVPILDNSANTIVISRDYSYYLAPGDPYSIIDYHLAPGSAAIDMGIDTSAPADGGVTTDLDGIARGFDGDSLGAVTADGSDYDIGAYESDIPAIMDAITVLSPNGGELISRGSLQAITWSSTGNVGANVKIVARKGTSSATIVASTPNDGNYAWLVPATYPLGNNFVVEVSSVTAPAILDVSDAFFTIQAAAPPTGTITVVSPNGGETLQRGATYPITWSSTGDIGASVKIYVRRGTAGSTVVASTPNDGHFEWTIPTYPVGSGYTIEISSVLAPSILDASNADFSLSDSAPPAATITVTAPNGGEFYLQGETLPITWTSAGPTGGVVDITAESAGRTFAVAISTANDGSFDWAIPAGQIPGTDYTIVVRSIYLRTAVDTSDAVFTIGSTSPVASLTLISPNGGETLVRGSLVEIQWSSTGDIGANVRIIARRGTSSGTIASSTPNDGSYAWTVPTNYPTGTGFTLEISSVTTPAILDTTDASFSISATAPTGGTITVLSPNGGESFLAGATIPLTWSSTGNAGTQVQILAHGAGQSFTLAATTDNDGAFDWAIPVGQATATNYTIEVRSLAFPAVGDSSNAAFTIGGTPPASSITVTSPNGGETINRGATVQINWSSTGSVGANVRIVARKGTSTGIITNSTANDGNYVWTVPANYPLGPGMTLEISSVTTPSILDTCDTTFTITP